MSLPVLTPLHKEVIVKFAQKFGMPPLDDSGAQWWTHRMAEQMRYSFPAEDWGHKSAGPGRPHSSDVICRKVPFVGYDIVISVGSPEQQLNPNAEPIDLSGQIFEQVAAVNHLGEVPDPEPEPEPEPQPDGDTKRLLISIEQKVQSILEEMVAQRKAVESAVVDIKKLQAFAPQVIEAITKGIKIRF